MANWTRNFTASASMNSGQEFTLTDYPTTQMVNAPYNNTLYLYDTLITNGNYTWFLDNTTNNANNYLAFYETVNGQVRYTDAIKIHPRLGIMYLSVLHADELYADTYVYADKGIEIQYGNNTQPVTPKIEHHIKIFDNTSADKFYIEICLTNYNKDVELDTLTKINSLISAKDRYYWLACGYIRDDNNNIHYLCQYDKNGNAIAGDNYTKNITSLNYVISDTIYQDWNDD